MSTKLTLSVMPSSLLSRALGSGARLLPALVFAGLFWTSSIQAAEILVTPNRGTANDIFLNPATDTARVFLQQNRSYECLVIVREFDAALPKRFPVFNPSVRLPNTSSFSATPIGSLKPGLATPVSLGSQQQFLRIGLLAPQTGSYSLSFNDGAVNGTAVPGSSVRCNDVTLYGGFNRFFAQVAVVELSNNTFSDLQALITIIDFSGATLVNQQAVFVPADNRADVVFANLPAERFGQILVTAVGSSGALSGYVAEYDQFPDGSLALKRERVLTQGTALP